MTQSTLNVWLLAIRPKTLFAALAPVLMGTVMAFGDGIQHWPSAVMALLGAVTIQIGTNLANDYFDYKKGADQADRIGPTRVTQAGLLKPSTVKNAFILFFVIAALISIYLCQRGGWPIALIAILSILSGILYTAGPFPLGYIGLGEIFVLVFFGPVAVGGTYYVQSLEINEAVIFAGLAPGLFSVAILTVNNLRDIETDRRAGKKTLAVRFGRTFAVTEYFVALLGAYLIPLGVHVITQEHQLTFLASLSCLLAVPAFNEINKRTDGPSLNQILAYTAKLLFIYSILFSFGWLL